MNFKKIITATFILTVCIFAEEKVDNTAHMSELKTFYTSLGEEKGYSRGLTVGYNTAIKDFRKLVRTYRKKIKALEAGKYFSEEGKITHAKIYKIKKNGVYSIKIKAPVVEQAFTAEDLFIIPLLDGTVNKSFDVKDTGIAQAVTFNNSLDLPDIESTHKTIRTNSIGSVRATVSVEIPYKSSDTKKFLEIFGSDYSETTKGYIVTFADSKEKKKFCIEFTGDKTCEKISEGTL